MNKHTNQVHAAGEVRRYHTLVTLEAQNVAAHSWGVATLIALNFPYADTVLYKAALFHDVPEVVTGDMPATFKWAAPKVAADMDEAEQVIHKDWGTCTRLTRQEKFVLKMCDMAELVLYARREANRGNNPMKDVAERGMLYIRDMLDTTDGDDWGEHHGHALEFYKYLLKETV
jgi:5'-deoxynucleotidase YfbR-like HD superfamily hydrolase